MLVEGFGGTAPAEGLAGPGVQREGDGVNPVGTRENHPGEVSGFAPPGDIHRIRNTGTSTAVSLHIYGTDITRIGSSARRYYN